MLYEWRNVPRLDGYSPAQLMFGYRQRSCLPLLPCRNRPISFHEAADSKDNSHNISKILHDRHKKSLSPLTPGQKVLLQNPKTSLWDSHETIRPDKHSYTINMENRFLIWPLQLLRPFILEDSIKFHSPTPTQVTQPLVIPPDFNCVCCCVSV